VVIHRAASQLPAVGADLLARTENNRPISTKKAADITKQIPYIPLVYRQFYQLLTTASNEDCKQAVIKYRRRQSHQY